MDDILLTLNKMDLVQMALAWLFVACYALALGGMLGAKGSLRAGLAAAAAAVAFSALSADWVHGALLVLFAIGGMAVFVASTWVLAHSLAWWLNRSQLRQAPAAPASPTQAAARPRPVSALRALWQTHEAP